MPLARPAPVGLRGPVEHKECQVLPGQQGQPVQSDHPVRLVSLEQPVRLVRPGQRVRKV